MTETRDELFEDCQEGEYLAFNTFPLAQCSTLQLILMNSALFVLLMKQSFRD